MIVGVVLGAIALVACSSDGSTTASSTTTSVERTGRPMVRIVGDGVAAVAAESVADALDTTDVVDRSVARSTPGSWLDLRDAAVPDEGANHGALASVLAEAPDLVLLSLGADLVPPTRNAAMEACQSAGSPTAVADCARGVLDTALYRQRVMAVVFDVLAHTRSTNVIVVGSGAADGTVAGTIDQQAASAVDGVAEAGASWRDRIAFAPRPAEVASVLRQRGWS